MEAEAARHREVAQAEELARPALRIVGGGSPDRRVYLANLGCLILAGIAAVVAYGVVPEYQRAPWGYAFAAEVLVVTFVITREVYACRDTILRTVRALIQAAVVGGAVYAGVVLTQPPGSESTAAVAALVALVVGWFLVRPPRRSRRVSVRVKRAVIRRDLKGEPFDPTRHQLDHIRAYSRGGGHTEDNLRVVAKGRNLRKGNRAPKPWDWFVR